MRRGPGPGCRETSPVPEGVLENGRAPGPVVFGAAERTAWRRRRWGVYGAALR